MIEIGENAYFDDDQVIGRFLDLIAPENEKEYFNDIYNKEFLLIVEYLNNAGYEIEQFPNVLRQAIPLNSFARDEIRSYIQRERRFDGVVRWDERRNLIKSLSFIKVNESLFDIPNNLQYIIKLISLRDARWEETKDDEKLRIIADVIENLLKKSNNKYHIIDENLVFYDLYTNELIKTLKSDLQVFRHHGDKAIKERTENFDNEKKQFYINLGIVLILRINRVMNKVGDNND